MFYAWHRSRRRHSFRCCVTPVIVMPLPECLVSLLGITGFLVGALPGVDDFPVIGVPWMEAGERKGSVSITKARVKIPGAKYNHLMARSAEGMFVSCRSFQRKYSQLPCTRGRKRAVPRASVAMRIA